MSYRKEEITSVEIATNELNVANQRLPLVLSAEIPFDDATQLAIPLTWEDIVEKKGLSDGANSEAVTANENLAAKYEELRKYENSYGTIVFLKIKDGFYPESLLNSFGIPLHSRALPYNDSEITIEGLVPKIVTGNAKIVSLSLPLMVDYTSAQCSVLLGEIAALKVIKVAKEILQGTANSNLAISFESAKTLVEDMRSQEDFFYRDLTEGTFRDAERNWGVIFEADKVVTELSIKAKFAASGLDANGATFHVGKALTAKGKPAVAGVTATIMANGVVVLSTTQEGEVVITGKCVGCHDITLTITIVPGTNQAFSFAFVLV
jgi:hypothetical protein